MLSGYSWGDLFGSYDLGDGYVGAGYIRNSQALSTRTTFANPTLIQCPTLCSHVSFARTHIK
jgi:hypothetical protein